MVQKQIFAMCKLWSWPWGYDPESRSWCDCVIDYQDPTWQWWVMARTRIFSVYALWPLPWRYELGSRSWHTLGSWTTVAWNIIQIQHGSEELWTGHGFWVCVHCDLDLGDMTLCQDHDTPSGHGQQLCEILSRSNMAVRSYSPDTDFGYVFTMTLTLEIWPYRGETLFKILGAKWAPKFWNLGAHFNFQGPTSFEYRFAKINEMKQCRLFNFVESHFGLCTL